MTEPQTEDLAAVEAIARHCSEGPPMPGGPLRLRLETSVPLRAIVPGRVAVALAERRAVRSWERNPQERERALAAMRAMVGDTPRAGEIEQLARAHAIETRVKETMFWRPWRTASIEPESAARARAALDSGRGVLVSPCHQGSLCTQFSIFAPLGASVWVASGRWFFDPPPPDFWGRRIARWWHGVRKRDERYVPTEGSYASLRTLLAHGRAVGIYFDMPGSRTTSFLGKQVPLGSGSARLAKETEALILPIRARREGTVIWVDVHEPLDARDYPDHERLHEALAAVHERWLLERPAGVEDPNREGSWGAQAA
jgi:lauroyl/myristoyl acyltransferase